MCVRARVIVDDKIHVHSCIPTLFFVYAIDEMKIEQLKVNIKYVREALMIDSKDALGRKMPPVTVRMGGRRT